MRASPTLASPRNGDLSEDSGTGDRAKPAGPDSGIFTRQSPILAIETIGPRRVAVGREAAYEVVLRNSGEIAADQVMVTIDIPSWTEVTGNETSTGTTTSAAPRQGGGPLTWKIGRLEPKGREKLVLRLVPRQSRAFDLAVKWDCTPANPQGLIEVQEPRLGLSLLGPREVLFGKGEIYKLEVSNAGNGDAENVVVAIAPDGQGDKRATATHAFGRLPAGQKKSIDVELTARQAGKLSIHLEARGDNGLRTELTEEILVRRAAMKVEVEGPKVQYVGTEAIYRIRVSNPGTASVVHPVVSATLPAGGKFVSSPQGGRPGADPSKVIWSLENLPAGAETTISLTLNVAAAGAGRVEVQCAGDGDLAATASATTQFEAMAKLVLTVEEPTGPVSVGSEAVYQLNIQNRGTANAENVEVVTYFSQGIEPVAADGLRNRLAPGQVVFELIPAVTPGQTLALKVKAKAAVPGNHIFRVEVQAKATGTRLVREGTTRFYGDAARPSAVAKPAETPDSGKSPRTARH